MTVASQPSSQGNRIHPDYTMVVREGWGDAQASLLSGACQFQNAGTATVSPTLATVSLEAVSKLPRGIHRRYLVIHCVHPIRTQGLDGLADEVCSPTVEHAEAQVLVESFSSSSSVQPPEGTEAAFGSAQERPGGVSGTPRHEAQLGLAGMGVRMAGWEDWSVHRSSMISLALFLP